MPNAQCLNNIQSKQPPKYCGENICGQIQGDINEYCSHNGLGGDVPVPQFAPGGKCWCCCSCTAWGTPVEVDDGSFKLIEDIASGDMVRATGVDVSSWSLKEVTDVGGIAPGVPIDFCYTAGFLLGDGTTRLLTSTADHLFLVPDGKLMPIQELRPGDNVVGADGQPAKVEFVSIGQFSGGVRNFSLGAFEAAEGADDPLAGHLVNTAGLITADLAVQAAYWGGNLGNSLLATRDSTVPPIGSRRFFAEYDTRALQHFIDSPEEWPAGFVPNTRQLFNIPVDAVGYFPVIDHDEGFEADLSLQDHGDSQAAADFKHLKQLLKSIDSNVVVVADWANESINAWYFKSLSQEYIVFSGGVLRLDTITLPGMSLIASHLFARMGGPKCVAAADYWGVAFGMRQMWYDENFFRMFERSRMEIEQTFNLLSGVRQQGMDEHPCAAPSVACRLQAIDNGASFAGVPVCAGLPKA